MKHNDILTTTPLYDVVVIGAGPGGCAAAVTLAKEGLKVLLTEKNKMPRYKSCSGILIEKSISLVEQIFGCGVSDDVTCTPVQNLGMIFTDDTGHEYKFESRGLNIWRDKFDFSLANRARESGAQLQDECQVKSLKLGGDLIYVQTDSMTYCAKYVIDCSGAIGIDKPTKDCVITHQTYVQGNIDLDPHYFYAYLQPQLSGYDAWFNVKDGMLVLGVASPHAHQIQAYYDKFINYMECTHNLHISKLLKTDRWLIRRIQHSMQIVYGEEGILRAGESAGFLNPMGEGISCAMESGYHTAKAILSCFDDKTAVLDKYRHNVQTTADYMRRQWQLVARLSDKFKSLSLE